MVHNQNKQYFATNNYLPPQYPVGKYMEWRVFLFFQQKNYISKGGGEITKIFILRVDLQNQYIEEIISQVHLLKVHIVYYDVE